MGNRLDRDSFCMVYVPMALKGHTALEIAKALKIDKPSDDEKAQFVSQKASNYRRELRKEAEATAKAEGLDEAATAKLVETSVAKLPKLQTRNTKADFASFLDDLLAKCDAPSEEGEEENAETPE